MKNKMDKYYFIGEYGHFFGQILPFLEKYTDCKFEFATFKDCKIFLDLIWPGRFKFTNIEKLIGKLDEAKRSGIRYYESGQKTQRKLEKMGYKNIQELDKNFEYIAPRIFVPDGSEIPYSHHFVNNKIVYGEQFENKKYISVFPRKRKKQSYRNNITLEHINFLKQTFPNYEIIGHGLKKERDNSFDIHYCEDIYKEINYLNNSLFTLTPPSGFADIAASCGSDVIIIGAKLNPEGVNKYYESLKKNSKYNVFYASCLDDILDIKNKLNL